MLFRRRLILSALTLPFLALPSVVQAVPTDNPEVFSYDSNSGVPDQYGNPLGPFNGNPNSFKLPKFDDQVQIPHPDDPSFMTSRSLALVVLSVTATVYDGLFVVDNEGLLDANVVELTVGARIEVGSDTPDAPLVVVTFPEGRLVPVGGDPVPIAGDDPTEFPGFPDFAGPDSAGAYANGNSDSNNATLDVTTPGVDANDWKGVGEFITWNFDANAYFKSVYKPSVDPASWVQSPTYQFTAEVMYFWEVGEIPEPQTCALLGVAGACLLRRRRRRKLSVPRRE